MPKTRKLTSKGWAKQAPGTHERTIMRKNCGSKYFLGPVGESCFPICRKGTCKIDTKGIYAAYVRAREYGSKLSGSKKMRLHKRSGTGKHSKHSHTKKLYNSIAAKAKEMLKFRGFGPNLK